MAETDPYQPNVFYQGEFVTSEFFQTFSELGVDRRIAVLATISAKPAVSQLVMNVAPTVTMQPTNLPQVFNYYHVNTSGVLVRGTTPTQFADKTDHYLQGPTPPSYLVFTDEIGGFRYVTSTTGGLVSSATAPSFELRRAQYVGPYLEFIGANGYDIYRVRAGSSNVISTTLDRSEPERTATIRISNGHHFPFDGVNLWFEGLIEMGDITSSIDQLESGFGGVVVARTSTVSLQLADNAWAYLVSQSWDDRDIEVRVGITTDPVSTYRVVLKGKTERAEADLNRLTITVRDQGILFDRSIQTNAYAGTGGYEGHSDVTGVLKPLLYGICRHFTPVLIDPILNLYQVHDGPIHQIFSVHQGGGLMNNLGNVPQVASSLLTWNPTTAQLGGYLVDTSRGMFRLAAPAQGRLTVVGTGDTGIPLGLSFMSSIVRQIIRTKVPEAEIDQNSFDQYFSDQPGAGGIYLTEETPIRDALNQLVAPVRGIVRLSAQGIVGVKQLRTDVPVSMIASNNIVEETPARRQPPRAGPVYRVGYGKSWTVFDDTDFLDAASSVNVNAFLKTEYRYREMHINGNGNTRLPMYPSAKAIELKTLIDNPMWAGELAVWIAMQDHALTDLYEVTTIGFAHQIQVGDTVLVELTDYLGITNIRIGLVVEVSEKAPTSDSEDLTQFVIWA